METGICATQCAASDDGTTHNEVCTMASVLLLLLQSIVVITHVVLRAVPPMDSVDDVTAT